MRKSLYFDDCIRLTIIVYQAKCGVVLWQALLGACLLEWEARKNGMARTRVP